MNLTQAEVKYLSALQQKKFRDQERKFLLEGWRPVLDALQSSFHIDYLAALPDAMQKPEHAGVAQLASDRKIAIKELKEAQLRRISDTVHSQGIVALVSQQLPPLDPSAFRLANFIVACDRIGDPGNLGTIIRTCDWFKVDALLLGTGCVSLYNEKVIRSTAGSIFHLPIFEDVDLQQSFSAFGDLGFKVVTTVIDGNSLDDVRLPSKTILVLGNEARGVDPTLNRAADTAFTIPKYGKAESLNVGIACGIILAQWRSQMRP